MTNEQLIFFVFVSAAIAIGFFLGRWSRDTELARWKGAAEVLNARHLAEKANVAHLEELLRLVRWAIAEKDPDEAEFTAHPTQTELLPALVERKILVAQFRKGVQYFRLNLPQPRPTPPPSPRRTG